LAEFELAQDVNVEPVAASGQEPVYVPGRGNVATLFGRTAHCLNPSSHEAGSQPFYFLLVSIFESHNSVGEEDSTAAQIKEQLSAVHEREVVDDRRVEERLKGFCAVA